MIEAQLDYFAQAMLGEAAAMKRRQTRANIKKSEATIAAAVNEARTRVADDVQMQAQQMQLTRNKKLASHVTQARENYWQRKQALLRDLFKAIEKRLKDFVASDAYPSYMNEQLQEAMRADDFAVVQCIQRDVDTVSQLLEGTIIEASSEDFIGGFILLNEPRTMRVDCTLQTKLTDAFAEFDDRFGVQYER